MTEKKLSQAKTTSAMMMTIGKLLKVNMVVACLW
jgi:hypothetical protein